MLPSAYRRQSKGVRDRNPIKYLISIRTQEEEVSILGNLVMSIKEVPSESSFRRSIRLKQNAIKSGKCWLPYSLSEDILYIDILSIDDIIFHDGSEEITILSKQNLKRLKDKKQDSCKLSSLQNVDVHFVDIFRGTVSIQILSLRTVSQTILQTDDSQFPDVSCGFTALSKLRATILKDSSTHLETILRIESPPIEYNIDTYLHPTYFTIKIKVRPR